MWKKQTLFLKKFHSFCLFSRWEIKKFWNFKVRSIWYFITSVKWNVFFSVKWNQSNHSRKFQFKFCSFRSTLAFSQGAIKWIRIMRINWHLIKIIKFQTIKNQLTKVMIGFPLFWHILNVERTLPIRPIRSV